MSKKDDALKLAMDWYDSGNENPDDFANMIKQVIALSHAPEVREQPRGEATLAQQESEAVRAAWMAGYTEGEREAIEKQQKLKEKNGF